MIGELVPWQWLLNGFGIVLAWLYDLVGNYGVAIILLTILIKIVLLPLAWKQIKSMQHVQALQPKIKAIQKKYKNNKAKVQEETMRLYREAGVNPLGGCLPVLLLYPFLIAMYSVIRPVALVPVPDQEGTFQVQAGHNHIPEDSALFHAIITHQDTDFLWMNLQCTPLTAGTQAPLRYVAEGSKEPQPLPDGAPIVGSDGQSLDAVTRSSIDCGEARFPAVVPYALVLILMVASGIYMQRQTMRNTPAGAQSGQQQAILKYMPLLFGVFGVNFPAGLLVYWLASNAFQVGQQTVMLRLGHIGPDALEKRIEEQRARADQPTRPGIMERMAAKAENAEKNRQARGGAKQAAAGGGAAAKPKPKATPQQKPSQRYGRTNPKAWPDRPAKPSKGAKPGNQLKREDPGGGST
jgi:YidC/Oxa1 family membrane protein insertase